MINDYMVGSNYSPSTQISNYSYQKTVTTVTYQRTEMAVSDSTSTESTSGASTTRGSLFELEEITLPTPENLMEKTSQLYERLDSFFEKNGIQKDPPINIDYSYSSNKVEITSTREDAEEIEKLINEDPELKEEVRSVLAMASHVIAISESVTFQEEYRNSSNPEAVVGKYSHLFNGSQRTHECSLNYGENVTEEYAKAQEEMEEAEREEFFDKIQYLLLMAYIQEDPEEEEEEGSQVDSETGVAKDGETVDQEDPEYQYMKLRQEIKRVQEEALEMHGNDKNKYAMAIESYTMQMKREAAEYEERGSFDSGEQKDSENETEQA